MPRTGRKRWRILIPVPCAFTARAPMNLQCLGLRETSPGFSFWAEKILPSTFPNLEPGQTLGSSSS